MRRKVISIISICCFYLGILIMVVCNYPELAEGEITFRECLSFFVMFYGFVGFIGFLSYKTIEWAMK